MRVVVCDADSLMRELVESIVSHAGHDVVGVATDTASALNLLAAARPDVALIDVAMGVGSDFDLVEAAEGVGARVVVFSRQADVDALHSHATPPLVVFKPDVQALEDLLQHLDDVAPGDPDEQDRRQRPARASEGPVPTGVSDAQAFFEAVNNAQSGDALVSFDVPDGAESVAGDVGRRLRQTDRVLLSLPRAVRCFLPGGGEEGIRSVLARMATVSSVTADCIATAVIVSDGEHGADAFDRLKREGEPREIR